ncbi:MAG: hypothetical protein ACE5JX_21670, partial [Acidobacteriota bacterium]
MSDLLGAESEPDLVVCSTVPVDEAVIREFRAEPSEIRGGDSAKLSWTVVGAESISISNVENEPDFRPPLPLTGMGNVRPVDTTTYVLTACNILNECVSSQAIVRVRPDAPKITFFRANPSQIRRGETTTLEWEVVDPGDASVSVRVDNLDTALVQPPPSELSLKGNIQVQPQDSLTYTLTATSDRGEFVTAQATVIVRPAVPKIIFFRALPPEIRTGGRSQLEWEVDGPAGTHVTLDNLDTVPEDVPVPEKFDLKDDITVAPERTT